MDTCIADVAGSGLQLNVNFDAQHALSCGCTRCCVLVSYKASPAHSSSLLVREQFTWFAIVM